MKKVNTKIQNKKIKQSATEEKSKELNLHEKTKYEEVIANQDVFEGENYEILLQAPISNYSYFKFKSEQNWDADINSQLELNKYFTLDLKLLNEGISCIPFPERHNYDISFSKSERESIKQNVKLSYQKYKKLLQDKNSNDSKINLIKNKPVVSSLTMNNFDDDIDDLLNLSKQDNIKESEVKADMPLEDKKIELVVQSSSELKVDLEQWLDDILDD